MSNKIQIVAVGKLKEKYLCDAMAEYEKRLSRFCRLGIVEVADEKNPKGYSEAETQIALNREAERILPHLKNSVVITLDAKGLKVNSEQFSRILGEYLEQRRDVAFVIGSSLGLGKGVIEASDMRLSMSDMTFPHQLARVILIEQIYRAFKIISNEKYHK
ncbi:MAG: 23S rRNA (pseudouridine(1915)-N(3))-methyltransferase RlmH [Oscillospiraceae bacterium]|nr:23S rRNA (pseudouridine(1915)-N(3))-methyltransferase RlmH [Oscillospiraceae bacterium]